MKGHPGPLYTKPSTIRTDQKTAIRRLIAQRSVPAADAKDMMADLSKMPEADAQALIRHLQAIPGKKGTHGKQAVVTRAAALRPGDDVMAFQWRHGWIKIGGDGKAKRVPLIPEGGEGVPLEPGRRKVPDLSYKPAKPAPPLRHPLIPEGLAPLESPGSGGGGWEQDYVPPRADGWTPDLTPAAGVKALTSPGRPDGTGTADDPIDVRGDLDKALRLMHDGKHVRLNQPDELALLLDKVDAVAKRSAGPGGDKPDWDFGLLTVKGTNLFTAQSRGIPRINMPQFSGLASPGTPAAKLAGGDGKFADLTPQFADQLKADGIKVTEARVPAAHLRATQTELVGSKVAGFANAVRAGNPKATATIGEPIYVTRDHYVIDGHHRWAALMMLDALDGQLGNDTYQNVHIVDMDIGAAIPYSNQFALSMGIAGRGAVAPAAAALARMRADAELGGNWDGDPDVLAFQWLHGWKWLGGPGGGKPAGPGRLTRLIQGPSKGRSIFQDARGGIAGRGGLGAHAENLARRLEAGTSGGDAIVPMSAGERRAARLALRASPHPDAKALAGRIRHGAGDVPLSAYERGILADALTAALTGHDQPRRPARNWGITEVSPAYAAALITAKRGTGRYKHGWIKLDSAAAGDLDRGLNHDATQRVKHHLDKAAEHAQAGDHGKAEDHLNAALDAATYGGTAPRLKDTIRNAITEQTIKKRRQQKPDIPGAGHHVSRREAEGFAQMFPPGKGKARSRVHQGHTSGPFGRHLSKREARGFANLFSGSAGGEAPGAVPPGPPGLPSLVTMPGVDLLAAGTWHLSSGRQTFTRADLESAASAARCPAVGPPVIKIGHLDPRFKPAPEHDGEPAIGRVLNIKLNEAGTKLDRRPGRACPAGSAPSPPPPSRAAAWRASSGSAARSATPTISC